MDIYGTLGPACMKPGCIKQMFQNGMTGIRLNLSHISIREASDMIRLFHAEAAEAGVTHPKLLVDMQGPELRIGEMEKGMFLPEGSCISLDEEGIPVPEAILPYLKPGQKILLNDGRILLEVISTHESEMGEQPSASAGCVCRVLRGGPLESRKSIALAGQDIRIPVLTAQDIRNLKDAPSYGVTGIMQPFVRSREDLEEVRSAMEKCGCSDMKLFAKIENPKGAKHIREFLDLSDEIVIARGDLGNSVPLWELPCLQKQISKICREAHVPFMVVTQMLASMEANPVPTRAEVSDIFNAVLDGASSIMVTGETAIGRYPEEVIRYLSNTAREAMKYGSGLS